MSQPERPTRKVKLTLSPEAEKYVSRDTPVSARRMAAGGALPLPPIELASVLFALLHDPDDQVKQRAHKSLEELPKALLETVLTGPTHPAVLSFYAKLLRENEKACEWIALNASSDDPTNAFLASLPYRRIVDIVSQNQERLLRHEAILDALGENPLTGRAQIERILDFLGKRPAGEEEADADDLDNPDELSDEDAEAAVAALLGDEYAHLAKRLAAEDGDELDDELLEGNLFAAIQKMTVMQKIKLARSGGKEARGLLIRDRNKVVYTAVILSPKITDNEIVTMANNRNTPEEVLRIISMNRDYTKHYSVKLGLASNSKTPQSVAMKFLNYLQDKDLKALMKSRDVSSVISTQARRLLMKKGKV
ncbi:MAG: hypothetical protein GY733_24785 [bacterium]|nr:hypothetical protein [bacterium]